MRVRDGHDGSRARRGGVPTQYGPRVRAIGAYLVGYQHLPYERACETLADLLGVGMSTGTLLTVLARTSDRLTPFLAAVRDRIAAAPVAHFDETGLRVAGAGAWVHSASTATLSLFAVHPSRGHDAMAAAGILPVFTGIAVHAGYTPYRRYGTAHALCNAHHLRELASVLDTDPSQTWAADLTRLPCEINVMARSARTGGPRPSAHACSPSTDNATTPSSPPAGRESHPAGPARPSTRGQPPRTPRRVRHRRTALRARPARAVRQQPRRTRHPHGQTPTEDQRRAVHLDRRRNVLRHPQLPVHRPQARHQRTRSPH